MTALSNAIVAAEPVQSALQIREATPADTDAIARIMYEAFTRFQESHGFASDFPNIEAATGLAASQIADPTTYAIVATSKGRVVGSNFLTEGDPIRGVGPISVDPDLQNAGVGRRLMQAVLERGTPVHGVRLLQDTFNTKSMALYASLGFRVREPVVVMTGRASDELRSGSFVRPMTPADLIASDNLARRVHGYARATELRSAYNTGTPVVLERGCKVVAYMTMPNFWLLNHGVAETQNDLRDLVLGASAASTEPISFLAPTRNAEFFHWCLRQGFSVVKPMTLMTRGDYNEPRGGWFPSVMY
jgi:predicted N-acetyltransferase YhbS